MLSLRRKTAVVYGIMAFSCGYLLLESQIHFPSPNAVILGTANNRPDSVSEDNASVPRIKARTAADCRTIRPPFRCNQTQVHEVPANPAIAAPVQIKSNQDTFMAVLQATDVKMWNETLPSTETRRSWCPRRSTTAGTFVQNLYRNVSLKHATACSRIERIGAGGDGGKHICVEHLQRSKCVVYSLGSRLDFTFENHVLKRFACEVHTFDCTVGTPNPKLIPRNVEFHPWCVGGGDEIKAISSDLGHNGEMKQYYTLQTIKQKLGHSQIDLLKMDIERHEFSVFETMDGGSAPVQIAFEIHLHNAYGLWHRPVSAKEWDSLWMKLVSMGYRVFSYEPNPACLCCCEFSLTRFEGLNSIA